MNRLLSLSLMLLSTSASAGRYPQTFEGACAYLTECGCPQGGSVAACVNQTMRVVGANPTALPYVTGLVEQNCATACQQVGQVLTGQLNVNLSASAGGVGGSASVGFTGGLVSVQINTPGTPPPAPVYQAPVHQVVAHHAAPAPAHFAPVAMDSGAYRILLGALENASFSSDKVDVVRNAVRHNHFTVQQLIGILNRFDFSSDKIEALQLMVSKTVDPENAFQIGEAFDFSSDKKKAQGMFR